MRLIIMLLSKLKRWRKYLHDGGLVHVNIAQINSGDVLKNKIVLVTGGSSGIGLAIAKKCISEGASVVITGRNRQKLNGICELMNTPLLRHCVWDVSDAKIAYDKIALVNSIFSAEIDIVFNNAGIYTNISFLDMTPDVWDTIQNTNIKGLFFLCQSIANSWIQNKRGGKIINIASNRGLLGATGPYGVSKWGVMGLTKGLAKGLFGKGIIVNAIAPGMVASGINNINIDDNAFANNPLANRVALPEEIAEIAVFLASDAANNIVGQTIVCDGGNSLN